MKKNKAEEDNKTESYSIYSKPVGFIHSIYLSDSVEDSSFEYEGLLDFLTTCVETDTVNIYLANFGGACHSGIRLAHAIQQCVAPVNMHITAPCYSMGAILAISGHGIVLYPGTFLMFHNYSSTERGKGGELIKAATEYKKHFEEILCHLCVPFLTKKEIERLLRDEDVYIHASDEDIHKRVERHYRLGSKK